MSWSVACASPRRRATNSPLPRHLSLSHCTCTPQPEHVELKFEYEVGAYYYADHATGTTHWDASGAVELEEPLRIAQRIASLEDTVFGEGKHGSKRAPPGSGFLTRLDYLEEDLYGERVMGSNVALRLNKLEGDATWQNGYEGEESEAESEVGSTSRGRLI